MLYPHRIIRRPDPLSVAIQLLDRNVSNMATPMNLEKQIKRHILARSHEFFAVTHPGFEVVCSDEIQQLRPGREPSGDGS